MTRALSPIISLILIALLGISSIAFFHIITSKQILLAQEKSQAQQQNLQASLTFPPQITSVKATLQDPYTAIATLEYYGLKKIPLIDLYLRITLPNGTSLVRKPTGIIKPEECLTSNLKAIQPGAYCLLLVNLTKIFGGKHIQYNFYNSSVGITPLIKTNSTPSGFLAGQGKGSEPYTGREDLNLYEGEEVKYFSEGGEEEGSEGSGGSSGPSVKLSFISLGSYHSFGYLNNGTLFAWGYNGYGQLGLGYTSYRETTPKAVKALEGLNVTQITAGDDYTCALLSNGSVYCWGYNGAGELGLGDTTERHTPTLVTFFEQFYGG